MRKSKARPELDPIVRAGLSGDELAVKMRQDQEKARALVECRQEAARAEIVAIEKKYQIAVLVQPTAVGSPGLGLLTVGAGLMLVPFETGATSLLDKSEKPSEGQVDHAKPQGAS